MKNNEKNFIEVKDISSGAVRDYTGYNNLDPAKDKLAS